MNSGFEYAGNSIEIINYRYNREDADEVVIHIIVHFR